METWIIMVLITLALSALLKFFFNFLFPTENPTRNLPPGPFTFPVIGNFLLPRKVAKLEPILLKLHAKFGGILTLHFGSRPSIFIADRFLAHQALIQNGAIFADRPPGHDGKHQNTISMASYGPTWRVLRRNLTSEVLHSSHVKSYSHVRQRVLLTLMESLNSRSRSGEPIPVMEYFQQSMFSLLVLMCFGDNINERKIKEIKDAHTRLHLSISRVNTLNMWPRVTRFLFSKQFEELFVARKHYREVLIPLIRERERVKEEKLFLSYVDTLLVLQLPEHKRNLSEEEIISLSTEFLNGGSDTTSTTLQWIMANLVKYPHIQEKLFAEIKGVVGDGEEIVKEDDLQNMQYLKAVILEGLRRHPPGHFALPHAVTDDVVLDGFVVPKNGTVNFFLAEIGWDPKAWEDPMAFKPERFLSNQSINSGEEFSYVTGSKEIKMMPFGAGRRICPGYALAMLHLEYFVANMVWCFEWKAVAGDKIDMEEKQEVLTVMKKPLQVLVYPRSR